MPAEVVTIRQEGLPQTIAELDREKRPLLGGLEVMNADQSELYGGCTLGFNAIRNGVKGFITSSHCTRRMLGFDGISMYQDNLVSSEFVGRELADPAYSTCRTGYACRYSDAAFVDYADPFSPPVGYIYKTENITPRYSDEVNDNWEKTIETVGNSKDEFVDRFKMGSIALTSPTGTILHKVGRRSGWTSGQVLETCYTQEQANYVDGKQVIMLCTYRVGTLAAGGDSGSAVFSRELYDGKYGHRLHGIVWGALTNTRVFLFSHITNTSDRYC